TTPVWLVYGEGSFLLPLDAASGLNTNEMVVIFSQGEQYTGDPYTWGVVDGWNAPNAEEGTTIDLHQGGLYSQGIARSAPYISLSDSGVTLYTNTLPPDFVEGEAFTLTYEDVVYDIVWNDSESKYEMVQEWQGSETMVAVLGIFGYAAGERPALIDVYFPEEKSNCRICLLT